MPNGTIPAPTPSTSAASPTSPNTNDDAGWETVHMGRHRAKSERPDERRSGTVVARKSRHDRDRDVKVDEEPRRAQSAAATNPRSAPPASSTEAFPPPPRSAGPAAATSPSGPTKSVWGLPGTTRTVRQVSSSSTTAAMEVHAAQTPKPNGVPRSHTVPSSPSLNGTSITATSSTDPNTYIASPHSAETASTSTAPTSVIGKTVDDPELDEEEPSWTARPDVERVESITSPAPTSPPEAESEAIPPITSPISNPWEERRRKLDIAPAQPILQFGSLSLDDTTEKTGNEGVKIGSLKKQQRRRPAVVPAATSVSAPASAVVRDEAWPDVQQAAAVVAAEETKTRKESEESSVVSEGVVSGSKGGYFSWLGHEMPNDLARIVRSDADG